MKTLVRRTPQTIFNGFPSIFDELLNTDFPKHNRLGKLPAINVKENETEFNLEMAVPGYKKEDLQIEMKDDLLHISAEFEETKESNDVDNYTRREFHKSSFKRSFSLPENIDIENISASCADGILHLHLPKKNQVLENNVKTISIQ
ncbi:MAG: Hsp20/alpha crystallin family protein [Bacteroidetes bacterium]|nr:Hsp20/alpha crystallin family protein [Bacteroidota bacterium]